MIDIKPRRRDELLGLAEELSKGLKSVEVPYLTKLATAARGVTPSTLSHAIAFLHRVRDRGRFGEFLRHFHRLDRMTAQNPANPKADHRVIRRELERFLADHPDLTADELLYVLSWSRRLLPRQPEETGGGPRPPRGPRKPPPRGPGSFGSTSPPSPRQPTPDPPTTTPGEALWKDVELSYWQGRPTVHRNHKTAASCDREKLDAKLLKRLKKEKAVRVDARVVQSLGSWRITSIKRVYE